jgi:hypothetical protein
MVQREQLNLRLPPKRFEVLAIAAVLDDLSITDYVKKWLELYVDELEKDPDVAAVLEMKAKRNGVEPSNVTQLPDRRQDNGP